MTRRPPTQVCFPLKRGGPPDFLHLICCGLRFILIRGLLSRLHRDFLRRLEGFPADWHSAPSLGLWDRRCIMNISSLRARAEDCQRRSLELLRTTGVGNYETRHTIHRSKEMLAESYRLLAGLSARSQSSDGDGGAELRECRC